MEAIPREAAEAISLKVELRYLPVTTRDALRFKNVFSRFHYKKPYLRLYMNHASFLRHKSLLKTPTRVYITHLDESFAFSEAEIEKLLKVSKILVQNQNMKSELLKLGLLANKIQIVYGAVSADLYFPLNDYSEVKNTQVLIVGDCKPRKNPGLMEEAIRMNPQLNFVIHGKNWEKYSTFYQDPPANLRMMKFNPSNHPQLLRESSALLSLASNEGGPFPILEAMASGTPVAATSTGFAPDLISEENGILLPLEPSQDEISAALQSCLALKKETWNSDMTRGNYSWEAFGKNFFQ